MIIVNAFSVNMLARGAIVQFRPVSIETARKLAKGAVSAVGHVDTAAVYSSELGIPVPYNRVTVSAQPGDALLIGQYHGPRLPEGATTLPEGASVEWWLAEVLDECPSA